MCKYIKIEEATEGPRPLFLGWVGNHNNYIQN